MDPWRTGKTPIPRPGPRAQSGPIVGRRPRGAYRFGWQPGRIVLSGNMYHPPNVDGACFFLEFQVNVVLDNSEQKGVPIVIETNRGPNLGRIITERGDPEAKYFKRDLCNVQNLKANLLGYTFMRMQLHDLAVALDVLAARPEVNPARLGACGLSTGGMMTLFLTAIDRRVQTATISGTLTSYRSYAMRIETSCGTQLPV